MESFILNLVKNKFKFLIKLDSPLIIKVEIVVVKIFNNGVNF